MTTALQLLTQLNNDYVFTSKQCVEKLLSAYHDLEWKNDGIHEVLRDTCSRAAQCWDTAVLEAEKLRKQHREDVEAMLAECSRIRDQLGDVEDVHLPETDQGALSETRKTLKALHTAICAKLALWQQRKQQRLQEYEVIQAMNTALQQQLGITGIPPKLDITRANLEFLMLEQERLQAEKELRLKRMEDMLSDLRVLCTELGLDDKVAAADVHPSLKLFRDKNAQDIIDSVKSLAGDHLGDPTSQVSLSDAVFQKMEDKITEIIAIKDARQKLVHELEGVLECLWNVLSLAEEAPERTMFNRVLTGSYRLHTSSIDKCQREVERLEVNCSKSIEQLVSVKLREVQTLSTEIHIQAPDTSQLLDDMATARTSNTKGQMAQCLSKVVQWLTEAEAVREKRMPILAAISELSHAVQEVQWLKEYEADSQRYKGRDANRNIKRASAAEKVRERAPGMLEALKESLSAWHSTEGAHFQYDGKEYVETLEQVATDLQQAADRQARLKPKPKPGPGQQLSTPGSKIGSPASRPTPASSNRAPLARPSTARASPLISGIGALSSKQQSVVLTTTRRPMSALRPTSQSIDFSKTNLLRSANPVDNTSGAVSRGASAAAAATATAEGSHRPAAVPSTSTTCSAATAAMSESLSLSACAAQNLEARLGNVKDSHTPQSKPANRSPLSPGLSLRRGTAESDDIQSPADGRSRAAPWLSPGTKSPAPKASKSSNMPTPCSKGVPAPGLQSDAAPTDQQLAAQATPGLITSSSPAKVSRIPKFGKN